MVQAGRVMCVFTPFLLSAIALACMIVLFLAGTRERNETLGDLYFLKLNLTNFDISNAAEGLIGGGVNGTLLAGAMKAGMQQNHIYEYYTIYLNNYCAWNRNDDYQFCSPRETKFYFDPLKVWNLDNSTVTSNKTDLIPLDFQNGLEAYRKASIAMYYLYAIGTACAAATILVGISAIFSRWGSFFTAGFAAAAALFLVVASAIATSIFGILKGVLVTQLDKPYGAQTTFGNRVFALTWIGAAFAIGASAFWTLSICCCSGRSPYNPSSKNARGTRAVKTPYTYERVGTPEHGGSSQQYQGPNNTQSMPLRNLNVAGFSLPGFGSNTGSTQKAQKDQHTAYEPFRANV